MQARLKDYKNKKFKCDCHNKYFDTKSELNLHLNKSICCPFCKKVFQHKTSLSRHKRLCELKNDLSLLGSVTIFCESCKRSIEKRYLSQHYRSFEHLNALASLLEGKVQLFASSLGDTVEEFRILNLDPKDIEIAKLMISNKKDLLLLLEKKLLELKNIKFRLSHSGFYSKIASLTEETEFVDTVKTFSSDYYILNQADDLDLTFDDAKNNLLTEIESFQTNSSGWFLVMSLQVSVQILRVVNFGNSFIELPKKIRRNRSLLNIVNNDEFCLIWSILALMHSHKFSCKLKKIDYRTYLPFRNEIVTKELVFPLNLREVDKLENLNKHLSLSINIYDYESGKIGVLRLSAMRRQNHVNLLLIYDENFNSHYVLIVDLVKFVKPFITSVQSNSDYYFCDSCIRSFKSETEYNFHIQIGCIATIVYVPKNKFLKFDKQHTKQKHFMVFVCDFETFSEDVCDVVDQKDDASRSFTKRISQQHVLTAAYKIQSVIIDDEYLNMFRSFCGPNALESLVNSLVEDAIYFYKKYLKKKAEISSITPEAEIFLNKMKACYICGKVFSQNTKNCCVVVDHCHINHKKIWTQDIFPPVCPNTNIRLKICLQCNAQFQLRYYFITCMHGGSRFDFILLLRFLLTNPKYQKTVKVIPRSKNNFISMSFAVKYDKQTFVFKFVDSLLHLKASLNSLAFQCKDKLHETLKYLTHLMPEKGLESQFNLLKLPMFYDIISGFEQCKNETQFPPIEKFVNKLKPDFKLLETDYNFALQIYKKHCKNWLDYILIYENIDICITFDVLSYYRNIILTHFNIDPVFFCSSPALSYQIFLSQNKTPLQILPDITMLSILLQNIRAGISYGTTNHIVSNNCYVNNPIDKTKPHLHLLAFDIISLYSYVMSNFSFPTHDFTFVLEPFELELLKLQMQDHELSEHDDYGYLFLVKISLDKNLHSYFDSFPLFCETKYFLNEKSNKLISTLLTKDRYLVHSLHIQLGLRLGYTLDHIYFGIKFRQTKYLSTYLLKLQDLRKENSEVPFLNSTFKLLGM